MKELEKPTHLKTFKCRNCKGPGPYMWVIRKHPKSKEKFYSRTCVPCRRITEGKSQKKLTEKGYFSKWVNANREHLREYQRNYYSTDNRYKQRNCIYSKRLKQRTLPNENLSIIKEFYSKCPIGYEVDHIIPLNGKNVSGLHTITNLQYLKASDNRRKSNKTIF